MCERVRIGVLGCGSIMRLHHLPRYPQIPEAQVEALCDRDESRAASAQALLSARLLEAADQAELAGETAQAERLRHDAGSIAIYTDPSAMLEAVDAVDVATPARFHPEHAALALKAGRHVLVEKPMARTWWEAAQIRPQVDAGPAIYQHGENWIYGPVCQIMRGLVEAGAIGRVQRVQWFQAHTGPNAFTPYWFADPLQAGGGSLTDWGVHSACAAWYVAGFDKRPVQVRSDGIGVRLASRILEGRLRSLQVEDDALIEVTLRDPATGTDTLLLIEGTWSRYASQGKSTVVRVEGTRGEIEIEGSGFGAEETLHVRTRFVGERAQRLAPYKTGTLLEEAFLGSIRSFCVSARDGVEPVVSYDVGLDVMAILGAGYLSELVKRQAVTLDEFRAWSLEMAAAAPAGQQAETIIRKLMAPYQPN
jgi:predicted dehydrogenase